MLELKTRVDMLDTEFKTIAPFPDQWEISAQEMIRLVDAGVIGMDGFRYQFREYAQDCWKRNLNRLRKL